MIETEHSVSLDTAIDSVWDYVQKIERWAALMPGYRECHLVDESASKWILKVGAGGLLKTVTVLVRVDEWAGPEGVNFSFRLDGDHVEGGGTYRASRTGSNETEVTLKVHVIGSGPLAPMWEAVIRPLLPQMMKSFAGELKTEIEKISGPAEAKAGVAPFTGSRYSTLVTWLRNAWRSLFRSRGGRTTPENGVLPVSETNKTLVLKFIEAMGACDGVTAATCLAPDAFTLAKGFGKFAGVRHFDTIVGTIDAFRKLVPNGLNPDIKSVTAEGDRVVVEFEGNAITCEGKPYNNQYCMVFTLYNGKIQQVNEYFCTLYADEVLWPLVEQMAGEIP